MRRSFNSVRWTFVTVSLLALGGCHKHHGTAWIDDDGYSHVDFVGIPSFRCDGSRPLWLRPIMTGEQFDDICGAADQFLPGCSTSSGSFGIAMTTVTDEETGESREVIDLPNSVKKCDSDDPH